MKLRSGALSSKYYCCYTTIYVEGRGSSLRFSLYFPRDLELQQKRDQEKDKEEDRVNQLGRGELFKRGMRASSSSSI